MKKLLVCILALIVAMIPATLTGCSFLEDVVDNTQIQVENELLKKENQSLKEELATLKFDLKFPNGVITEDTILNNVIKTVSEGNGDAIQVVGTSQVTINGGKFDGGNTPLGGAGNTALWVNSPDTNVIINGGKFTIGGLAEGDTGHIDLIYVTQGTVEITGGYFEGADNTVWLLNCKDTFYKDGTAKIIVSGGTFVNWNPADNCSEGDHTSFLKEGYTVETEIIDTDTIIYKVVEASEIEPEEPDEF